MKIVFFTGAGLSADSNIPTFRGKNGMYQDKNFDPTTFLSSIGLSKRLDEVHQWHDDFRVALRDKVPNRMHHLIAEWKRRMPDQVTVLTTNVDDLLERAGCPDVVHLHGKLTSMQSMGNSLITCDIGYTRYLGPGDDGEQAPKGIWDDTPRIRSYMSRRGLEQIPAFEGYQFRCPVTNGRMRPGVVLFDDLAPMYAKMYSCLKDLKEGDVLVTIGHSGLYPAICEIARGARYTRILNNLEPSRAILHEVWDEVLWGAAVDRVGDLDSSLERHLNAFTTRPKSQPLVQRRP